MKKAKKALAKNKILLISIASLLALAAILFGARRAVAASKKTDAVTYRVRRETYENVIEIAGTVSAAKEQNLQAKNDGTVVAVYVQEGDMVKKGDILLQVDDTTQVYNLAKLDYDLASTRITGAARQIQLMEVQRASLVQKVNECKITATFDGVIASWDADVGDYIEAKDSIGTLVDKSYLTAKVEVAETDVSKLKVGQKVQFSFPAYKGTVEGYVVSFPAIGETTSRGATVVKATVRIDDVPESILPNFSFTGKIQITEPETKLVVERYAIGRDKENTFVEVIDRGGQTHRVVVEVEPYGIDYVNVLSGLEGGEVLKAQVDASKSGRMNVNKRGSNTKNSKNTPSRSSGGFAPPPGF